MKANILHAIFFDTFNNWDHFFSQHPRRIRQAVKTEVKKFRYCGDTMRGHLLFAKDATRLNLYLYVVKVSFVQHVRQEKVKDGLKLFQVICFQ